MFLKIVQSRYYWLLPVFFWAILSGLSLAWNLSLFDQSIRDIAYDRGRVMYEMVRRTKINPIVMQNDPEVLKMHSMDGVRYRVVSNHPMNPENQASAWESSILKRFATNPKPYFDYSKDVYRYVGPLFMQELCLSCHKDPGARVGSVRGGISVAVDAQPIIASQVGTRRMMIGMHLVGFLVISAISILFLRFLRRHWRLMALAQQTTMEQKQFLTGVTNSMSDACVVLDCQGRVTYVNPECVRLLGWPDSELQGVLFTDRIYAKQSSSPDQPVRQAIAQTLDDGQVRKELEDRILDRQGEMRDVSFSVSPLVGKDRPDGVVVMFHDISKRKFAEAEQARLERELNQSHKMTAVGQLAGGIAHEINTPIQYVGDNLHFFQEALGDIVSLLGRYKDLHRRAAGIDELKPQVVQIDEAVEEADLDYLEEELPKAIEQSIAGASQVAGIVQAMKEFAHPGSVNKEPTDMNRLVSNAVAVCKNEWKYAANLELDLDEQLPPVTCMASEISQVMLNLIVNAAYAIEAKGEEEKGRILISTRQFDDQVEIRVADSGTGIPKSVQPNVFNPFFTTKDVGRGSGQGLAIVQDMVVVKHQGKIFFETEEGRGTTFVVRLPLSGESGPGDQS
jgi:PAS domain S-box-containing protein